MKPLILYKEVYVKKDTNLNYHSGVLADMYTATQFIKKENQYILSQQEMEELITHCVDNGIILGSTWERNQHVDKDEEIQLPFDKQQFISNLLNK